VVILNPDDMCPCNRGKPVKHCCLDSDGILRRSKARTQPPEPRTGFSHPNCYAAQLLDCSQTISGDHFVSSTLLKALREDGVEISGLPWQNEKTPKVLPRSALKSNVLCVRHNSALSLIDDVAKDFFMALDQISDDFRAIPARNNGRAFLFNGHDIERWMLKTLCTAVVSGNASTQIEVITSWKPNLEWQQILFGEAMFPSEWGLYMVGAVGHSSEVNRTFRFAPLSNSGMIYGGLLRLTNREFLLAMAAPPDDRKGTVLAESTYRPAGLVMRMGNVQQIITFTWEGPISDSAIVIDYTKPSSL
jgi:hypothetical protein